MGKRRSASALSRKKPDPPVGSAPAVAAPGALQQRGFNPVIAAGILALLGVGAYAIWWSFSGPKPAATDDAPAKAPSKDWPFPFKLPPGYVPPASTVEALDWSDVKTTAEGRLLAEFVERKNNGDPAAFALLGPAPDFSGPPVPKEEADRLQTDFYLRQNVQFTGVGRDKKTGALVLFGKGGAAAPTMQVITANGLEPSGQRVLINPDLTVEVRDGHIYGVAANLHVGP
jgi:hypothetical protein